MVQFGDERGKKIWFQHPSMLRASPDEENVIKHVYDVTPQKEKHFPKADPLKNNITSTFLQSQLKIFGFIKKKTKNL